MIKFISYDKVYKLCNYKSIFYYIHEIKIILFVSMYTCAKRGYGNLIKFKVYSDELCVLGIYITVI